MEKGYIAGLAILAILCLISAGMFGYAIHPEATDKVVEVTKEVPVEKVVTVEKTVTVDSSQALKDNAVAEFLKKFKKDADFVCGGEEYDFDQISVSKADDFSVNSDDDVTTVDFDVKLKFKQSDVAQCYLSFEPSVEFEDGEKAVVSY
jgi:hypothetical protein